MNKFKFITLAAIIFAMAFTFFGCSGDDGDDPDDTKGGNSSSLEGGSSSSGGNSSSSSEGSSSLTACVDEDVTIGAQIWRKCNLSIEPTGTNNAATNSWCYDNEPANCEEYGRLYDYATAMALPENCNEEECKSQINEPHQGICPDNFHIPTNAEWEALIEFAGGEDIAAGKLRAVDGWHESYIAGTDDYKFSALPGGRRYSDETFHIIGYSGEWWSSSFYGSDAANKMSIDDNSADILGFAKSTGFSVRCVKD